MVMPWGARTRPRSQETGGPLGVASGPGGSASAAMRRGIAFLFLVGRVAGGSACRGASVALRARRDDPRKSSTAPFRPLGSRASSWRPVPLIPARSWRWGARSRSPVAGEREGSPAPVRRGPWGTRCPRSGRARMPRPPPPSGGAFLPAAAAGVRGRAGTCPCRGRLLGRARRNGDGATAPDCLPSAWRTLSLRRLHPPTRAGGVDGGWWVLVPVDAARGNVPS